LKEGLEQGLAMAEDAKSIGVA